MKIQDSLFGHWNRRSRIWKKNYLFRKTKWLWIRNTAQHGTTYLCDGYAKYCSEKYLKYLEAKNITVLFRVANLHHLDADPDPGFRFTFLRIRIQLFALKRIRIQLFALMRIRIQLQTTMRIHADPYPISWFHLWCFPNRFRALLYCVQSFRPVWGKATFLYCNFILNTVGEILLPINTILK